MVVGVISELNPLHMGHAHLFAVLRRQGAQTVICAMSGQFVQRGEAALLNKHSRAEMAVDCGADLVVELPTPWAMATAELFARGGVQALALAGCTHLAFGSECGRLDVLQSAASALEGAALAQQLRAQLQGGVTFAAARQQALQAVLGAAADCLRSPNDTLAVEYLRALAREKAAMTPMAVPRIGGGHDGAPAEGIASASYIRESFRRGADVSAFMPDAAWNILQREAQAGRIADTARLERAILARLRQLEEADFARYDTGGEGLYHRVYDAVHRGASLADVLEGAKTKRYTAARLRRMVMGAWLGLEAPPPAVPYLRVLSANAQGRQHLAALRGRAPVLTKSADVSALGAAAETLFRAEAVRTDLYTLAYEDLTQSLPGSDWRTGPVLR